MVQDDLITLLKAATQTDAEDRIAWDRQRDGIAKPYIVLHENGGQVYSDHSDDSNTFRRLDFTVRCVATTGALARTLAEQVRDKLHLHQGDLTGINHIIARGEPVTTSEEVAATFQATQDFSVYYYA